MCLLNIHAHAHVMYSHANTHAHAHAHVHDRIWIGSVDSVHEVNSTDIGLIIKCDQSDVFSDIQTYHVKNYNDCIADTQEIKLDILHKIEPAVDVMRAFMIADTRGILVHCHAGENRSALVIGVYLVNTGISAQDAKKMLVNANATRYGLDPSNPYLALWNPYFEDILFEYAVR